MESERLTQGTEEWLDARKGRLTASHAKTIAVGGKGLRTLCLAAVDEILSDKERTIIHTPDMDEGNALEPEARFTFEALTGKQVVEVGFFEYGDFSGCSPDGEIVGESALIEIKCLQGKAYLDFIINHDKPLKERIDPDHYHQMQMQMLIREKQKCYYVVYNPHFEQDIIITEVPVDSECQEKIKDGLEKGKDMILDFLKKYEELRDKINNCLILK